MGLQTILQTFHRTFDSTWLRIKGQVVDIVLQLERSRFNAMIEVICNDRLGKKVRVKCKYPLHHEREREGGLVLLVGGVSILSPPVQMILWETSRS